MALRLVPRPATSPTDVCTTPGLRPAMRRRYPAYQQTDLAVAVAASAKEPVKTVSTKRGVARSMWSRSGSTLPDCSLFGVGRAAPWSEQRSDKGGLSRLLCDQPLEDSGTGHRDISSPRF